LSQEIHQCRLDIDRDFAEFERLSEDADALRKTYDHQLAALDETESSTTDFH
jgi:hypothetical protein